MKAPAHLKMEHLDHDCCLIMEAIRRLEESTWMLKDEDDDYGWYLFPKIRDSLNEHVALEEQVLLPMLSSSECRRHQHHHHRILILLEMAEMALRDQRAEHFQETLRCLAMMLDEHHRQFKPPHNESGYTCQCSDRGPLERIFSRLSVHAL